MGAQIPFGFQEYISVFSFVMIRKKIQRKLKFLNLKVINSSLFSDSNHNALNHKELENYAIYSQMAPIADRLGRILTDLSAHIALAGSQLQSRFA